MRNRYHGSLLKKATAAALACLLLVAGSPLPVAAAESCKDWNTAKFFETATVDEVRACLNAGENPNEKDTQGLTALHRAARDTTDPAVIDALLEAGANPRASSRAGRLPRYYARKNKKIQGSDAWQRLMIVSVKEPKKADWSQVQAVPHHRKTKIRLYEDVTLQGNRKIKGRFNRPRPIPSRSCSRTGNCALSQSWPCARFLSPAHSKNESRGGSPWRLPCRLFKRYLA